jgi:hypothetical protein
MDTITVSVKDLFDRAKELKDDGMDFVEISLAEPDDSDPGYMHFTAWKKSTSFEGIDYEEIEAVK